MTTTRPTRRIAVLHVGQSCARFLEGLRPDLCEKLFVIPSSQDPTRIAEVGLAAWSCGIRPQQTLSEALLRHRDLLVIPTPETLETLVRERLEPILDKASPSFREIEFGQWEMDLTGCERLLQGRWEDWAAALLMKVKSHLGVEMNVAIAGNRSAAQLLARSSMASIVVACGNEAQTLAPLPVQLLPELSPALWIRLQRLNVRTLGDLAQLPRQLLARRFGPLGEQLCIRARGLDLTCQNPGTAAPIMDEVEDLFAMTPDVESEVEHKRPIKARKTKGQPWHPMKKAA
jgi:DNA polymerase IV